MSQLQGDKLFGGLMFNSVRDVDFNLELRGSSMYVGIFFVKATAKRESTRRETKTEFRSHIYEQE